MTTRTISQEIIVAQQAPFQTCHNDGPVLNIQPARSATQALDGFMNRKALLTVLNRVSLASLVYIAASTMFIYALATAFNVQIYGWGPLQAAEANVVFVVYFTTIMLPFALLLAFGYRYKECLPYQKQVLDLNLPYHEAYEMGLGAVLSLAGSQLISADEKSGSILCKAPQRQKAAPQEIKLELKQLPSGQSRLTVSSQPMLNAIEHLLFGFTLSVDGGRNKANLDQIISFLTADSCQSAAQVISSFDTASGGHK